MNEHAHITGEYMLAKQVGNRAFFAKVILAVSPSTDKTDLSISVDAEVDPRWHSAVSFGIDYAWEQLRRERPQIPPVAVRVISVEWQPADTTKMTVAFAAANAIWATLKYTPNKTPTLDVDSGSFNFPN